ncbi:pancreatic secretory granule membrane major glycoprotein GP2-like [Ranitomeya variabilis]|uniref:pancreatic secretory granule membrane major glycoprotein GP2-like n=1 Tax=Ranitomeya variabilis TaxID=490064 RepID=UPI00405722F4
MKLLLFFALCSLLKYAAAQCYSGTSPILCSDATCGGFCTSDNGCYCNDGLTQCVPNSNSCGMEDNSCCAALSKWYWDSTQQCCTQTVVCSPSCYSDEVCDKESATCNCNASKYAGNTPQDLAPTVACDGGVMVASVSQCRLEELGYDYESFHLIDNSTSCTFTYNETIKNLRERSIQVKAAVGWCGNINTRDSSKIYFTNTLHISPFSGPLITKNPIVFNFTCIYNLTMQTSLNFSLNPILSSVVIPSPGAGLGYFTVTMSAYSDSEFTVPIEADQDIYVGSDIYVGVFSEDLDADSFSLRLQNCYATPSQDLSTPNVQLITGGCAANSDVVTNVLQNGNGSEARFQTSAFLFSNYPEVYLFCEVEICNKSSSCGACTSGRSGKAAASGVGVTLSYLDNSDLDSSGHHTVASWTMLAASLLGLFVKFF